MANNRDNRIKAKETERKVEIASEFLIQAVTRRMKSGSWGRIEIIAVIEAGFVKEVQLDDRTVVRDLPEEKINQQSLPPLTENGQPV